MRNDEAEKHQHADGNYHDCADSPVAFAMATHPPLRNVKAELHFVLVAHGFLGTS